MNCELAAARVNRKNNEARKALTSQHSVATLATLLHVHPKKREGGNQYQRMIQIERSKNCALTQSHTKMDSPQSPTRGKEVQMQMQMQMHYGIESCFHMMPHQNNLNLDMVEKMMESPHRQNNHDHNHNSTEFSEYQSFPIHRRKEESAPAYPTATSNSNANASMNFSTPRRVYGRKRKISETSSSAAPTPMPMTMSAVSIQPNIFETPDKHGNGKTPQNATCHGASYSTVPPMHHNISKPVLDTTPVSNLDKSTSLLFSDSGPRLNFLEARQQLLNAEVRVSEFSNGALKSQGSAYSGSSSASASGSGSQSNGQIHDVPHNVLKKSSLEANDLNSSDESLDDIFFLALPGSDPGSLLGSAGASSGQASRNSSRASSIANANTHAYAKNDMYVPNVTRLLPSRAQNSRSCESFGPSACQSHYSNSNFPNSKSNSNSHSNTSTSRDSDEYFQRDCTTATGIIYSAIASNKPRGCGIVAPGPRPTSRHYFMPILLPRCMSSDSPGDHSDYGELDAWNRLSPSREIIETCAEAKPIAHSNFDSGNCKAQSGNIGSKDVDTNAAEKTDCSKPLRGCSSEFRAPIPKSIDSRNTGLQENPPLHPSSMDAAIAGESLTSASKSMERAWAPNTASVSVSASASLSKSQNAQTSTSTLTMTPPIQLHAPKPIRLRGYSYSEHSHNCIIGNGTGPTPRSVYSTSWSQPNTGTGDTVTVTGIDLLCAKEQEEEKFVNESPALLVPTLQAPCPTLGPAGSSQFNSNTLDIAGHRRYSNMLDSINCYSPIFQD